MKETVLGGISSPPAYPCRQLLVPTVVSAPGQGRAPEDALEKVMTEERREAVPHLWTEWMTVSALRCFGRPQGKRLGCVGVKEGLAGSCPGQAELTSYKQVQAAIYFMESSRVGKPD